MFDVRLADNYLYGKWLFTWRSLVMSYFVLSFFPQDVLDEIWGLIELVLTIFLPTLSATVDCMRSFLYLVMTPLVLIFTFIYSQRVFCKLFHVRLTWS